MDRDRSQRAINQLDKKIDRQIGEARHIRERGDRLAQIVLTVSSVFVTGLILVVNYSSYNNFDITNPLGILFSSIDAAVQRLSEIHTVSARFIVGLFTILTVGYFIYSIWSVLLSVGNAVSAASYQKYEYDVNLVSSFNGKMVKNSSQAIIAGYTEKIKSNSKKLSEDREKIDLAYSYLNFATYRIALSVSNYISIVYLDSVYIYALFTITVLSGTYDNKEMIPSILIKSLQTYRTGSDLVGIFVSFSLIFTVYSENTSEFIPEFFLFIVIFVFIISLLYNRRIDIKLGVMLIMRSVIHTAILFFPVFIVIYRGGDSVINTLKIAVGFSIFMTPLTHLLLYTLSLFLSMMLSAVFGGFRSFRNIKQGVRHLTGYFVTC